MRPRRKMKDKKGDGAAAARAQRERSEEALRRDQENVIAPLRAIHESNHFAELIRDDILAGYRRRGDNLLSPGDSVAVVKRYD